MIQNLFILILAAITLTYTTSKLHAQLYTEIPRAEAPMVIELYTSQGCSSCPPADKILEHLAEQDNIIALSFHITYWDYLNWKDTLGDELSDIRQHGYASLTESKRIYTPQMIVNGRDIFIGSDSSDLKAAIKKANNTKISLINITSESFTLPQIKTGSYRIWGFGYRNEVAEKIRSGENDGRSIIYTRPVTEFLNLGNWDGRTISYKLDSIPEDIDGLVILAQENGYGPIVAAGKLLLTKGS